MDTNDPLADAVAFFCIVIGADGVSEAPVDPTTNLGQLLALEQQCIAEGFDEAVFAARAAELLDRLDPFGRHDA